MPAPVPARASMADCLRSIGRGKDGGRALHRDQARDLMTRLLAAPLGELDIDGFALAMRVDGETPDMLAGFMDAVQATLPTLALDGGTLARAFDGGRAIVLPSYDGAHKLSSLTPLLALLLAQEGVPVLVHGIPEEAHPTTSASVFSVLGMPAVRSAAGVADRWSQRLPAYVPLQVLHPALARLLALPSALGLGNAGHTLAKLLQPWPGALRVVDHTHPEDATSLAQLLQLTQPDALLLRGTEGEPEADARHRPALNGVVTGRLSDTLSIAPEAGVLIRLPELPTATDASSTACVIQAMLSGAKPLPWPIVHQVASLLRLRRAMR